MNTKEVDNLIWVIDHFNHICLNIQEYNCILQGVLSNSVIDFDPISIRNILITGKYCFFKNQTVTCWISKNNPPGHIRVPQKGMVPRTSADNVWEAPWKLENLDTAKILTQLKTATPVASGATCYQCQQYFPYANPVQDFQCWACRNNV